MRYCKHGLSRYILYGVISGMSLLLLTACAELTPSPLSPQQTAQLDQAALSSSGSVSFVFSPGSPDPSRASMPAGKLADTKTESRTASGKITPRRGGKLRVKFDRRDDDGDDDDGDDDDRDDDGVRVKSATFVVKRGSIEEAHRIRMRVTSGSTLDDVSVEFTPSGLSFDPPARLTIILVGELDEEDLENLHVWHIEGDKATEVPVKISSDDDEWELVIEVPGFSWYDLGGDEGCGWVGFCY